MLTCKVEDKMLSSHLQWNDHQQCNKISKQSDNATQKLILPFAWKEYLNFDSTETPEFRLACRYLSLHSRKCVLVHSRRHGVNGPSVPAGARQIWCKVGVRACPSANYYYYRLGPAQLGHGPSIDCSVTSKIMYLRSYSVTKSCAPVTKSCAPPPKSRIIFFNSAETTCHALCCVLQERRRYFRYFKLETWISRCSEICEHRGWGKLVWGWGKSVSSWGKGVFRWGKLFY